MGRVSWPNSVLRFAGKLRPPISRLGNSHLQRQLNAEVRPDLLPLAVGRPSDSRSFRLTLAPFFCPPTDQDHPFDGNSNEKTTQPSDPLAAPPPVIRVVGARERDLADISVNIRRGRLTVFTGISASGKCTLAVEPRLVAGGRLIPLVKKIMQENRIVGVDSHRSAYTLL